MEIYRPEDKYGYQHKYQHGNVTNVTYNHYGNIVFASAPQIQPPTPLDPEKVQVAAKRGYYLTMIATMLGALLIAAGILTLVFAGENIGFPVFNFGPLLTGLIVFFGYGPAFWRLRNVVGGEIFANTLTKNKCPLMTLFVMSTICITFSILSGVFALLSGIACTTGTLVFYSEVNGVRTRHDGGVFCNPNKEANAAMAFIDIALCLFLAVLTVFGMVYFCLYARYYGIRGRYYRVM